MSRKQITILGATGSIGTSTLDLVERNPDDFEVVALTAARNVEALADAARRTRAKLAVIDDESRFTDLRDALSGTGVAIAAGRKSTVEAASGPADFVMAAIVGCAGLEPVMAAVEAGKTVGLANKEALVTAGSLMTDAAARYGATILPVDSEHNAIFQCLAGQSSKAVSRIILTASGGPFRSRSTTEMAEVTPKQAVAHPNWSMGAKISVDSATLMNKGLELIEAHHLFGLPSAQLDVVIHPQSVIHSMVEFVDGSVLAQLGSADMRVPIAHTLAYPERMETPADRLDFAAIGRLDFESPDPERFPALRLTRQALEAGGAHPVVLNAANEVAVDAFLNSRLDFLGIASLVEEVMAHSTALPPRSIADVIDIDRQARQSARHMMSERAA